MKIIKRFTSILIVVLTIIYLFSGCAEKKPAPWTIFFNDKNNQSPGALTGALNEIKNVPISDLTVYDDYFRFCLSITSSEEVSSATSYLHQFNSLYPVERIEKVDDEHIFAVYKMREKGQTAIIWLPFERKTVNENSEEKEVWIFGDAGTYFTTKELYYSDYEHLKIGDCAANAIKIDDTTAFLRVSDSYVHNGIMVYEYEKLLKDGIIRLYFAAPEESYKRETKKGTEYVFDPDVSTIVDISYTKDVLGDKETTAYIVAQRVSSNDLREFKKDSSIPACVVVTVVVIAAAVVVFFIRSRKRAKASATLDSTTTETEE